MDSYMQQNEKESETAQQVCDAVRFVERIAEQHEQVTRTARSSRSQIDRWVREHNLVEQCRREPYVDLTPDEYTQRCFYDDREPMAGGLIRRDSVEMAASCLYVLDLYTNWSSLRHSMNELKRNVPSLFERDLQTSLERNGLPASELMASVYFQGLHGSSNGKRLFNEYGAFEHADDLIRALRRSENTRGVSVSRLEALRSVLPDYQRLALRSVLPDDELAHMLKANRRGRELQRVVDVYRAASDKMSTVVFAANKFKAQMSAAYLLYRLVEHCVNESPLTQSMMRQKQCASAYQLLRHSTSPFTENMLDYESLVHWTLMLVRQHVARPLAADATFQRYVELYDDTCLSNLAQQALPLVRFVFAAPHNKRLWQHLVGDDQDQWPFADNELLRSQLPAAQRLDPTRVLQWRDDLESLHDRFKHAMYGNASYHSGRTTRRWAQAQPISVQMLLNALRRQNAFAELERVQYAFSDKGGGWRADDYTVLEMHREHASVCELYYTLKSFEHMLYELGGYNANRTELIERLQPKQRELVERYFVHYFRCQLRHIGGRVIGHRTMVVCGSHSSQRVYLALPSVLLALVRQLAIGDMVTWTDRTSNVSVPIFPLLVRNARYEPRVLSNVKQKSPFVYDTGNSAEEYPLDGRLEQMGKAIEAQVLNWAHLSRRLADQALLRSVITMGDGRVNSSANASVPSLSTLDTGTYEQMFPHLLSIYGTSTTTLRRSIAHAELQLQRAAELEPNEQLDDMHYRHIYSTFGSFLWRNRVHYIDCTTMRLLYELLNDCSEDFREQLGLLWLVVRQYEVANEGLHRINRRPLALCMKDKDAPANKCGNPRKRRSEDEEYDDDDEVICPVAWRNAIDGTMFDGRQEAASGADSNEHTAPTFNEHESGRNYLPLGRDERTFISQRCVMVNSLDFLSTVPNTKRDRNEPDKERERRKNAHRFSVIDEQLKDPHDLVSMLYRLVLLAPAELVDFEHFVKHSKRARDYNITDVAELKRALLGGVFVWPFYANDKRTQSGSGAGGSFFRVPLFERSAQWFHSKSVRSLCADYWQRMHATHEQLHAAWMAHAKRNGHVHDDESAEHYRQFLERHTQQFEHVPRADFEQSGERRVFVQTMMVYLQQMEWLAHFPTRNDATLEIAEHLRRQRNVRNEIERQALETERRLMGQRRSVPSRAQSLQLDDGADDANPFESIGLSASDDDTMRTMSLCLHLDHHTQQSLRQLKQIDALDNDELSSVRVHNVFTFARRRRKDTLCMERECDDIFEDGSFPLFTPFTQQERSDKETMRMYDFMLHSGQTMGTLALPDWLYASEKRPKSKKSKSTTDEFSASNELHSQEQLCAEHGGKGYLGVLQRIGELQRSSVTTAQNKSESAPPPKRPLEKKTEDENDNGKRAKSDGNIQHRQQQQQQQQPVEKVYTPHTPAVPPPPPPSRRTVRANQPAPPPLPPTNANRVPKGYKDLCRLVASNEANRTITETPLFRQKFRSFEEKYAQDQQRAAAAASAMNSSNGVATGSVRYDRRDSVPYTQPSRMAGENSHATYDYGVDYEPLQRR